jgi:hypothetical protein
MIGGIYITVKVKAWWMAFDRLLRAAWVVWPDGVVESDTDPKVYSYVEALKKPWLVPCELFLYKDMEARQSWIDGGKTDLNTNYMLAVNIQDNEVSFVMDNEESEANKIIEVFKQLEGRIETTLIDCATRAELDKAQRTAKELLAVIVVIEEQVTTHFNRPEWTNITVRWCRDAIKAYEKSMSDNLWCSRYRDEDNADRFCQNYPDGCDQECPYKDLKKGDK